MLPERIRTAADLEALLRATTNYEERMPRDDADRAFDLARMRALLAAVADPQDGPRTVHVTGSKGKGSVCRMVDAILRAAALGPVGLYVSPHLERLAERVSVDGVPVADTALAAAADELLPVLRRTIGTPAFPTFFEILTAVAHLAFRARGVGQAVLEVGLGGRLDATNVCRPAATAITTVELEHVKILGDTLEKIAFEKAGILKAGVPCVTAVEGASPALAVVEARARALGVPLHRVGREIGLERVRAGPGPRVALTVVGPAGAPGLDLVLPVAGEHQATNAAVAVGLARLLAVPDAAIVAGLARVTLPGRMEQVLARPTVVVDGAHTPSSAAAAARAANTCFPHRALHVVLGCLAEKDVRGLLAPLLEGAARVVACAVDSPRGLPSADLAAAARALTDAPVVEAPDAALALADALSHAAPDDLILVSGSLYLAGSARTAARRYPGFLPVD